MISRGFRAQAGFLAVGFAAHALAIVVGASIPRDPLDLAVEDFLAQADDRLASYELEAREPIEVELDAVAPRSDPDPAGPGRRHTFEEGEAGAYEAMRADATWAIRGPADNPDPHLAHDVSSTRRRALFNVAVPPVPTSPWGDHDELGLDPASARGRFAGEMMGVAAGMGGLGARGSLYGGGGAGEGTLGLGGLGRAGSCAGGLPAGGSTLAE